MEDPAHRNYPQALKDRVGPRNMLHSWATDTDDPTVQPRWGKVGKQRIEDAGPLYPKRMETVDDEILQHALAFIRVPCIIRWPGRIPAGKVENGIISGLDWFPTFVAAAGNPNIVEELKKGKQLGDRSYKVHLDGYDQTNLITGKGPSGRDEIVYFTEGTLSAIRIDDFKYRFTDQPGGWFGGTVKLDWPILLNLRLDPFERTGLNQSLFAKDWWAYEFWRFVLVQQEVGRLAQTAIEFPPMQKGASFNLEAVKEQIEKAMQSPSGK
jgi:arylsulfatase